MSRAGLLAAGAAITAAAASLVGWQTTTTAPAEAVDASTLDGAALFKAKGCATCHAGPGSTSQIGSFPSLSDAPAWAGDRRPGMTAAEYIAESIREPAAFISPAFVPSGGPTAAMPDLGLTETEIDALVDHLLQG
ncbi:MAG: c-type cytochrome [Acidimicrobiia bacterium]